MEIIEKECVHDYDNKYAKKGVAGTALGLAIGALGVEFLRNGGFNLFGNNSTTGTNGCTLTCKDRFEDRQVLNDEIFGLYKSQIDADFGLYKGYRDGFDMLNAKHNADAFALYKNQRDSFDVLSARISELETKQAVNDAIDP
jgi:hypothetical protein